MFAFLSAIAFAAPFAGSKVVATDAANLRSGPATDASVVTALPLGTPVEVLETGVDHTLWGIPAPWVRVRAEGGAEGWLWSGLVTDDVIDLGEGNGVLASLRGVKEQGGSSHLVSVEVAGRVNGKLLVPSRADMQVPFGHKGAVEMLRLATRETGLPGDDRVVTVGFSEEACAGLDATLYWVTHGEALAYLTTLYEGADAPYFTTHELHFPNDEEGRPGVIVRRHRSGEWGDDDQAHLETDQTVEHLLVDGKLDPPYQL
jgi:hypothetical protein